MKFFLTNNFRDLGTSQFSYDYKYHFLFVLVFVLVLFCFWHPPCFLKVILESSNGCYFFRTHLDPNQGKETDPTTWYFHWNLIYIHTHMCVCFPIADVCKCWKERYFKSRGNCISLCIMSLAKCHYFLGMFFFSLWLLSPRALEDRWSSLNFIFVYDSCQSVLFVTA